MATIGRYYLKSSTSAASLKNVDTNSLVALAGIPLTTEQPLSHRVSDSSMVSLLNLLVQRTNDGFFGFAAVSPRFFAMMIQAFHYDQTIAQVITTMKTVFNLVDCQLGTTTENNLLTLSLSHPYDDPDNFLTEFLLVFVHRILSWLANQNIHLSHATVDYYPEDHEREFEWLFRCPVLFNQRSNSLVFDANALLLSVVRQRHEFSTVIENFPLVVLQFPGEEQRIHLLVKQLLEEKFKRQQQILSAIDIAGSLSISTATLRRRLAHQETSFGQIKADFLKEQAIKLLKTQKHSIDKIASLLGYSEARAFSRAFKLWSGLTPSQYKSLS